MGIIINYWIIIPLIPLAIIFVYLRRYFVRVTRELKRLEGLCKNALDKLLKNK